LAEILATLRSELSVVCPTSYPKLKSTFIGEDQTIFLNLSFGGGTIRITWDREHRSHSMKMLVVDVGGTSVKILATGHEEPRKFPSGPKMTAQEMVATVKERAGD
jgi:hypothetical protein